MKRQFVITIVVTLLLLVIVEAFLRVSVNDPLVNPFVAKTNLYQEILNAPLQEKEKDNRFIKHNIFLLEKLEHKDKISLGFVGTSRTKVLQPNRFGIVNAFNSASNSYNEITYGLLLEAIVLRNYLPNLKKIYVESSLLLRRPAAPNYIVEKEHQIYRPLLRSLFSLRKSFPQFESFQTFVAGNKNKKFELMIFTEANRLTIAELLGIGESSASLNVGQASVLKKLNTLGEYKAELSFKNDSPKPAINVDNPRVSRIKEVMTFKPFDYLFEMFTAWSKDENIEIVFFQPPVRSDMQSFQYKYGLEYHNSQLKIMAEEKSVKVVNLNFKGTGYSEEWEIFSDEDHLGTCIGNAIFFTALLHGEQEIDESGNFYQEVSKSDVQEKIKRAKKSFCEER